jgi:hypothetical protein
VITNNDNKAFPTCQVVLHDLDDCDEIVIICYRVAVALLLG